MDVITQRENVERKRENDRMAVLEGVQRRSQREQLVRTSQKGRRKQSSRKGRVFRKRK